MFNSAEGSHLWCFIVLEAIVDKGDANIEEKWVVETKMF